MYEMHAHTYLELIENGDLEIANYVNKCLALLFFLVRNRLKAIALINLIDQRQLSWFGHNVCMSDQNLVKII